MKNFVLTAILLCFSVLTFANVAKSHETVKQEVKTEVVTATNDLTFQVAVFSLLDVLASEGQNIDYSFAETVSGFTKLQEKPPLSENLITLRPRKKWIRQEQGIVSKKKTSPEKESRTTFYS